MPINAEWQDERGTTLARYEGPVITAALLEQADPASVCLRFIDPWGDTTFNQQQVLVLVNELEAAEPRVADAQRQVVRALLTFLRPNLGQVHTYMKFIGD